MRYITGEAGVVLLGLGVEGKFVDLLPLAYGGSVFTPLAVAILSILKRVSENTLVLGAHFLPFNFNEVQGWPPRLDQSQRYFLLVDLREEVGSPLQGVPL